MKKKVKLNLVGLNGNAFFLLGKFQYAARKQGFDQSYIDEVLNKCQSGDYDSLLKTLMEHTQ